MIKSGIMMKQDTDLIRKILLEIEADEHRFIHRQIEIEGYTQEEIGYHTVLLGEAGLAEIIEVTSHSSKSPEALITRLTWDGHEFLDSARQNHIWNQAKDLITNQVGFLIIA